MTLSSIINVTISRQTKVPSRKGFGFGNFVSNSAVFSERIKSYADADEVANDLLAGASTLAFATKYFSQKKRPLKLYVTKKGRDLVWTGTLNFSADFVAGNTINLLINGVAITAVPFNTNHATTLADLASAISAHAAVATATVTGARQITVPGLTVGTQLVFTGILVTGGASQAVGTITVTQYADTLMTYVNSLIAAKNINQDWYAVAIEDRSETEIDLVAAWVETQQAMIYVAANEDADVLTSVTNDIASELKALAYDRTYLAYSKDSENYPDAAIMGDRLPVDPGSDTWAYKQQVGIVPDTLTSDELTNALFKNANTYTTLNEINISQDGKMVGGEYADVIRGSDYLQVRMQEDVYTLLTQQEKVPFTDAGIASIVSLVRARLNDGVKKGIITDAFTITFPKASEVEIADKAARTLPDINWAATLQGAIHKVRIEGVLQL